MRWLGILNCLVGEEDIIFREIGGDVQLGEDEEISKTGKPI